MSLATLPSELYSAILSHIPPSALQISTLNLSRAIPLAPIPLRPLFENISISRQQQLPQLYRRLRYPPKFFEDPKSGFTSRELNWVTSFRLVTWQVDADVLVNVLSLLSMLEQLNLKIGPEFAPEHLRDIFLKPAFSLNILNLRFRPYVKTATYYQFLKGSYFDSTLEFISSWPSDTSLTRLSIIQDPLPPPPVGTHAKAFAQPIVFFSLTPLTSLSLSPAVKTATHVRLRVPARQLARFIAPPSPPGRVHYPFPEATSLDLSTCSVRDTSDIEALLNYIGNGRLQHLLLDNTGLCDGSGGEWEALGRVCALAGVKHSRDREKALKAWTQAEVADKNQDVTNVGAPLAANAEDHRPRRGRRGLAAATISLRDRHTNAVSVIPRPPPATLPGSSQRATKIRILPSPPRLLSLCTSLPRPLGPQAAEGLRIHEANARTAFAKGWSEGVAQLRSIWARLRQSQSNGVRVFRFETMVPNSPGDDIGMLAGLREMGKPDTDNLWAELGDIEPPILCFSGSRGENWADSAEHDWSNHPDGCGHRISWEAWGDNL